jgi:hypothetical protein
MALRRRVVVPSIDRRLGTESEEQESMEDRGMRRRRRQDGGDVAAEMKFQDGIGKEV